MDKLIVLNPAQWLEATPRFRVFMAAHSLYFQDSICSGIPLQAAMRHWPLFQLDIRMPLFSVIQQKKLVWSNCLTFVAQRKSGLGFKLHHSLDGLQLALRAWFGILAHPSRVQNAWEKVWSRIQEANHTFFYQHNFLGQCIHLIVYQNDLVATSVTRTTFNDLTPLPSFPAKDLGKLKYVVGIMAA